MLTTRNTQCLQVLTHLQAGNALTHRGSQDLGYGDRLAAVVFVLRRDGHDIQTTMHRNSKGPGSHAEYRLVGRARPGAGTACISGKHHWNDPVQRDRCCNGFRIEVRAPGAPRLPGEVSFGWWYDDAGLVHVWVRN